MSHGRGRNSDLDGRSRVLQVVLDKLVVVDLDRLDPFDLSDNGQLRRSSFPEDQQISLFPAETRAQHSLLLANKLVLLDLDTAQVLQKVQVKVLSSELSIGNTLEPNFLLLGNKGLDGLILNLAQFLDGDLFVQELVSGLVDRVGSEEGADCGRRRKVSSQSCVTAQLLRPCVPCSGFERIGEVVWTILKEY